MLSLKTRNKTGMSTHSLSNITPEVLARALGKEKRKEKKRKERHQYWKGRSKSITIC